MRILIDMNLSPQWVDVLEDEGHTATHWHSVGEQDASDRTLMQWAKRNGYVVFTHDLDLSAILAATQAAAPSVVQMRTDDVLPSAHSQPVLRAFRQSETDLEKGQFSQSTWSEHGSVTSRLASRTEGPRQPLGGVIFQSTGLVVRLVPPGRLPNLKPGTPERNALTPTRPYQLLR